MALFRIQARVIDLLGEQQIANCPTAISELFKNAYDACASRVMLDVYPADNHAVLWDDGMGMSESDVLGRWLVVGTANKSQGYNKKSSVTSCGRTIQGEKGIGRLAISTLGDSLLLISKKENSKSVAESYVALFINWNIVRNEKLMLEDIEVPVTIFSDFDEFDTDFINGLVDKFRAPLLKMRDDPVWKGKESRELFDLIMKQLDSFRADMPGIRRSGLHRRESGTLFYIQNIKEDIPDYVKRPARDQGDEEPNTELVQLLNNFQNSFDKPSEEIFPFKADVRRWDSDAKALMSVFEEWEAFTPDDLFSYDHHIDVRFDEWGQYNGILEVYDKKHLIRSTTPRPKRPLSSGPFHLRIWYFQGEKKATTLEPGKFKVIDDKLKCFGGIMIYRDSLRVLPYGRPEYDWLRFEERRSKSARRYHFSYRRMFGYITVSRERNSKLKDKAGREGLLNNPAYRQFRGGLIDFFSTIALRYFAQTEEFQEKKEKIKQKAALIEQGQKRAEERRKVLYKTISDHFEFFKNIQIKIEELIQIGIHELETLEHLDSPENALAHFNEQLVKLESKAKLKIPEDLPLGKDLELKRAVYDYDKALADFSKSCSEARKKYSKIIDERFSEARRIASYRNTLRKGFRSALKRVEKTRKDLLGQTNEHCLNLKNQSSDFAQNQIQHVKNTLFRETASKSLEEALDSVTESPLEILEAIEKSAAEAVTNIENSKYRMDNAIESIFGSSRDLLLAAQIEEIEKLREEVDKNLELVQLGLSVEIIDHELNRLYQGIKAGLQRLKQMVRRAPNARKTVEDIGVNFQHLEQKYQLMSPLYRGTYRRKDKIDGQRILNYVRTFLERPIASIGIRVIATESFLNFRMTEVPSVILPIFVNLADNAIYWLRDKENPEIVFDVKKNIVTVCDNGPGIHETQLDEIFKSFFSTKPGGRGLGLYVARANLTRYGHKIWATNNSEFRTLSGACFCIHFRDEVVMGETGI
ncbi:hypothetical protein DENIS_0535 [Desulfonema ishimotonii]|uniref:histidine kinase n=1 Tax=Desulfonema ishimotonii TaxID=45657 RepID=A0A401FRK8_9BACT|nr:ATP-binding protein [Desulfonema ishimotonii]GBC59596.1 hypothetical protein DENIS_0535 [Desulfonema ishimotonii]